MTRRLRWGLVALACGAILAGGTVAGREQAARLAATVTPAVQTAAQATAARLAQVTVTRELAIAVSAGLCAVTVLAVGGLWLVRRRRGQAAAAAQVPAREVPAAVREIERLADRGTNIARIARTTGISQDAIRDVLAAFEGREEPEPALAAPAPRATRLGEPMSAGERTQFAAMLKANYYAARS